MNKITPRTPILETAWHRYAQLDANAISAQKRHISLKRWIAFLGVLATVFAILVNNYSDILPEWAALGVRTLLILTPITGSVIAAFANKFQQGQKYLALRAAAEEVISEIYKYRTIWRNLPNRNKRLNDRLAAIQRKLFRAVGGELVLDQYDDDLPPYYDPSQDHNDPGFDDITGDKYLTYRLENQLVWHIDKNLKIQHSRKRTQFLILAFGGAGAFLAAWGGSLAIWVAFTAAIASALIGWEELRGLDMKVSNYSQVILELNIIRDRWLMLTENEHTEKELIKMVSETENLLWNQNLEFVSAMRKALADAEGDEDELIEHALDKAQEATTQMQENLRAETKATYDETIDETVEQIETAIEDTAGSLESMYAEMIAHPDEEDVLPPEAMPEETFADIVNIESAVDDALAESAVVGKPNTVETADAAPEEELIDEDFSSGVVDEGTGEEGFVDEDFGDDAEEDYGDEFVEEAWDQESE
ncbi:MAG: SLATT domain-containing protein [Chloroflexota bacterium]|nr:SLATT domain-containing protein [Chloroflexota bacterium]